ncbi:MAG: hypothetical protein DCC65_09445 [Planctomycetota bacterium]|nr:MAG: hypothetical protein DCC65_09445 [Planctomycetota bacterium]
MTVLASSVLVLSLGWSFGVLESSPEAKADGPTLAAVESSAAEVRPLDWYLANWQQAPVDTFVQVCFAEGTPPDVVEFFRDLTENPASPRYQLTGRWPGTQGSNLTLTWSFVPDGLSIPSGIGEGTSASDLFARLDSQFAAQGGRATWINRFQQCFDRWSQLTGVTYTRITVGGNDWDDGAAWGSSGAAGLRGDVRICMKIIDGFNGVLAYNNFPSSGGDMVLDRSESWGGTGNQNRFLRNTIMHEHGHGLGILHVCPVSGTKLMEPFLNTSFDGLRHDDIRAGQRHYGDQREDDNSAGAASVAGVVDVGSPVTLGTLPAPPAGTSPTNSSTLSIDANAEQDWYRFSITGPRVATVVVTPQGLSSYDSCQQTGSCPSGCPVNSLAAANLNVQLVDTNGTTVLATADTQASGLAETISGITLPAAGDYFVRVYEGDVPTTTQLYTLNISVTNIPCEDPTIDPIADDASICSIAYVSSPPVASGTSPLTWSLGGTPPPGMTIDSGSGVISWPNPVASATPYSITVEADSNCGSGSDSVVFQLTVKPGDFTGDGLVTDIDVPMFVDHLLEVVATTPCAADVNLDGFNDALDVQAFIDSI